MQFVERFRHYLDWCPNRLPAGTAPAHPARLSHPAVDQEPPADGRLKGLKMERWRQEWYTAIAVTMLFATIFVGGNFWWTAVVGMVLVIMLVDWYVHDVRGRAP